MRPLNAALAVKAPCVSVDVLKPFFNHRKHRVTREEENLCVTLCPLWFKPLLNQRKTLAQVNSPYFGIAAKLLGRSVPENSAFIDNVGTIRH